MASGEPRVLANNAEVRVAPYGLPDSGTLPFHGFSQERNNLALFRVNIGDGTASVLARLRGTTAAFPFAFALNSDRFGSTSPTPQREEQICWL